MNNTMRQFAINQIKDGLSRLSDECNALFNRMYPNGVDNLMDEQLDNALSQVERTLQKPHLIRAPAV